MGRDGYTGLAVLAASLFLFWATLGIERHPMVPVSPAFYPRIVLAIAAVLAAALLALDLIARRGRAAPAPRRSEANYALVALLFLIFAVYVVALPYLGFRVATFAFACAMHAVLDPRRGARKSITTIAVGFTATIAIYLVFETYLHVLLPRGRWTGF